MTIKSPRNSKLFYENLIRPNAVLAGISTANTRGFLVSRLAATFDPNAWVSLRLNLGRIFATLLRPVL